MKFDDNQLDDSREQDQRQDMKRNQKKGKNKTTQKTIKATLIAAVTLFIKLLTLFTIVFVIYTVITWVLEWIYAVNTPEQIYKGLDVDNLTDLIEIKGNETDGYHLAFKDGTDKKLDSVVEELKKSSGVKSIDKELLKKMIKAEVITQFPNLGGKIQNQKEEIEDVSGESDNSITNGIEYLAKKYGSKSDGANLTAGDGGYYYGRYLFDTRDSLPDFVDWCYADDATIYAEFEPFINGAQDLTNNPAFITAWHNIYTNNGVEFTKAQDEFAYKYFYQNVANQIKSLYQFDLEQKSDALKAVIFSVAVKGGPDCANYPFFEDVFVGTDEEIINKIYANLKEYWAEDTGRWEKENEAALKILNGKITINKNIKKEEDKKIEDNEFQGSIRIRRVTPNKEIGEVKNTGAGSITQQESTTQNMAALGTKEPIPRSIKDMMAGLSMPQGANIKYEDLSYLTIPYYDLDGSVQQGHMIIKKELADEVLLIFQELYEMKYPIAKMQLIDTYESGNANELNEKSIRDNNTVGFRQTAQGEASSNHQIGQAIDLNPLFNPAENSNVEEKYKNRSQTGWTSKEKKAFIGNDTAVYKTFEKYGWKWGGDWSSNKDYGHFEKTDLGNTAVIEGNNSGETESKEYTIAIAAGHNNTDNKGASYQGLVEEEMTIKVAEYVSQLFSPYTNIKVVQTGSTSSNPGGVKLEDRMQLAKEANPNLLVVIHFNATESHKASGVDTYYKAGDSKSKEFSQILVKTISNAMGLQQRGHHPDTETNKGSLESIGNSAECGFPCVLAEGGFLDNETDRAVLSSDSGLKNYAKGIVDGVLEYLGIENRGYGDATISNSGSVATAVNSKIYDLKYVPEKTFDKYVEENNEKALEVFTLDKDMKLITAKWSYTTEEGIKILKNSPVNYLPVLQKYMMPYEYLINWLIDCKDSNFVSSLADLAINSEFIIAIEDNVTTVKTVVDTQNRDIVRRGATISGSYQGYQISTSDWYTVSTDTKIKESVSNTIELTYADCWFVKFQKETSYTSATIGASNNVTADQGDLIGNFKITTYCSACNTPPGKVTTASGVDAKPNHTIAVHLEDYQNSSGPLGKGKKVVINGNIYTVEDTGDSNHRWGNNWIDIFIQDENGSCVCNYSPSNGNDIPVYVADNVKDSEVETNFDNTLINAIANVKGKVNDSTTVTTNYLGEEVTNVNDLEVWNNSKGEMEVVYDANIKQKRKITTVRTISNKYETGESIVVGNEHKFTKVLKENIEARKRMKPSYLFNILQRQPRTANMVDLTKYLLYKALGEDYGKTDYAIEYERYKYNDFNALGYGSVDISLTKSVLTKEKFVQALQAYYDKTGNINFQKNFLSRAEQIYDWGVQYEVNPELIITMALKESGFESPGGGDQNFWGLGTYNGASSNYIGSFEEGVKLLAKTFKAYLEGSGTWQEQEILKRYNEREAANCNSNGYGKPGTLKGMLSIYSDLCGSNTKHREGSSGDGGNYYLKVIYGTQFNEKCGNVHRIGVDDYTIQEKADYTAWLYEQQLDYWQLIFGEFGRLGGGGSIVENAVSLHEYLRLNGYYYAQAGIKLPNPNGRTIDCSSYVTWVLLNAGVEGFSEGMYQWTSYTFASNPQGWQTVSASEAQPGDIVVYPGHVEIVAENNPNSDRFTVYNCGGDSSIGAEGTAELPESSTSGRSKNSATIILRVPQ